jgi:hypothetical protein
MISVYCKKSFRGTIDIRDYIVKQALQNNEEIEVTCEELNGKSIYSTEELKNPIRKQGAYKSKFNGQEYWLYVYKWKKENELMKY